MRNWGSEDVVKPMTVGDLIKALGKFDKDALVCYRCCSEKCLLEPDDMEEQMLVEPRPDGWVANARPDKKLVKYVVFPGN